MAPYPEKNYRFRSGLRRGRRAAELITTHQSHPKTEVHGILPFIEPLRVLIS